MAQQLEKLVRTEKTIFFGSSFKKLQGGARMRRPTLNHYYSLLCTFGTFSGKIDFLRLGFPVEVATFVGKSDFGDFGDFFLMLLQNFISSAQSRIFPIGCLFLQSGSTGFNNFLR